MKIFIPPLISEPLYPYLDIDAHIFCPTPLLDNNQPDYASGAHDGLTIFGISKYSNCPLASAATLELMAYYGSLLVTPTYVESVLKGSEMIHDPESIAMIDKIRAGFDSNIAFASYMRYAR